MMFLKRNYILFLENIRKLHNKPVREVQVSVPWGKITGKWWGSTDIKPIILLHGLQDNAGSFDRLINLLSIDYSFLAIDLPGHGRSSHIPKGFSYEFLPLTFVINRLVEYFNWSPISLVGHSIHAIVCYNFACVYPEKIHSLVCLDGLMFVSSPTSKKSIRFWLDKYSTFEAAAEKQLEPPSYTLEELKKKRAEEYFGSVNAEYGHHIFMRNIAPSKSQHGRYYLIRDPVLSSMINYANPQTDEDVIEDAKTFQTPTILFKTDHRFRGEEKMLPNVIDNIKKVNKNFEIHEIDGTHHVHLNEPEKISPLIDTFLARHHKLEDSNVEMNNPIFDIPDIKAS